MRSAPLNLTLALVLAISGSIAVGSLAADKSGGSGKGGKDDRGDRRDDRRNDTRDERRDDRRDDKRDDRRDDRRGHFDDRQRVIVREHYVEYERIGRCPPGLAKKHNGCQPPGHAKRWKLGRPLPRDVVFYEVPAPLRVQFGPPPSGYRYVRVASDILMIAIGTGMVMDAIRDLGR